SYDPDGDHVSPSLSPAGPYPVGDNDVALTATDDKGAAISTHVTITVKDTEPPVISDASADTNTIWPPNHKYVSVTVAYTASDNVGVAETWLTATSNEPDNGTGDGDQPNDIVIVDNHHVKLRAERAGNGGGRIYTITIHAIDAAGNETTQDVTVTVPHDK